MFKLSIILSANTTATMVLLQVASVPITKFGVEVGKMKTVTSSIKDGDDQKIKTRSGAYQFEYA